MALIDGLGEYFPLSEASGIRTGLHAGKALTDNGTVGSGSGLVYGAAADFELSNGDEFLSRSGDASLQTGDNDYTVAAFFNLETEPADGSVMCLVDKVENADDFEYRLQVGAETGQQKIAFGIYGAANYPTIVVNTDLAISTWYLAWGWHDSVNDLIWAQLDDGAPVSAASLGPGISTTAIFRIGAAVGPVFQFDGRIGPVMYWTRMLTSQERSQVWNGGSGLTYLAMLQLAAARPYYRRRRR